MERHDIAAQQRATWDSFSDGWRKWDDVVIDHLRPVCDAMVDAIAPAEDSTHLDIATGTGEPGLTIAALAPSGRVVLSDLSLGMLNGVTRAVEERGLSHVEVREADATSLPFEDESFDSVTCRFGFMFFPDLTTAAREIQRVLRPGGVVSVAVWAEPADNPWAVVPMREIAKVVDVPSPSPEAPGLFRCAAPGFMASVFATTGFDVLGDQDIAVAAKVTPPERFWDYMVEISAPVVANLSAADDGERDRIRTATLAAMNAYAVDDRVEAPGLARVTTARKI